MHRPSGYPERFRSIRALSLSFVVRPTRVSRTLPSRMKSSVGMPPDPIICSGLSGLIHIHLDHIHPIVVLFTDSSRIGARALQGPHQGAQKSTKTGLSIFKTADSKVLSSACLTNSLVSIAFLPMIFVLDFHIYSSYQPNRGRTISSVCGGVIDLNQREGLFNKRC